MLAKPAGMDSTGLRERKKARTRRHIADTAARLFAEHGYKHVAVTDVAREAEVAEQTVYNYFPTKEQLVTDREAQVEDRLCDLIRSLYRCPVVLVDHACTASEFAASAADLRFGRIDGLRQDRGLCLFACST